MNAYRTHTCQALTSADVGSTVMLSGWINRKRDHGQLLFVDLRDHYGITQCVADSSDASFAQVEHTRVESISGRWLPLSAQSICVHSDTPGALEQLKLITNHLSSCGLRIAAT